MAPRTRKGKRPPAPAPHSPTAASEEAPPSRRRLARWLTAVTLVLLAAGGAWWSTRPAVRREPGLNILLITIDTLRADALGAYGHAGAVTPWMDRLAAGGVRFDDAHAHNVVTLPSHANILSGRYPLDHGVRDNGGFRFPPREETLATLLKARGYRTAAFVSAFPLDSRFGLGRGFDVYEDSFIDADTRPTFLVQERQGIQTVALARRWLEAQGGQPSFCWVHIYEPHYPYEPPEPLAERFPGDPYDGEVAAADAALGPLLEPLVTSGREGRTLVVLTADHGEALGEHGEATHGIFAYEATLKVPLILYQPRLFEPRSVPGPARHVDLLPTILDALSLPVPEGLAGRSLLAMAAGAPTPATTCYFEALSGPLNRGWAPLHGVIRDRMKYIDLPIPELYDLAKDPHEARSLVGGQPLPNEPPPTGGASSASAGLPFGSTQQVRLDQMRALLAPLRSADRGISRSPESGEARERLKSLGYVTGSSAVKGKEPYTAEDDPKRLISLDAMLQEVVGLYTAGDLPAALARCRELVRLRPAMPISLLHLAHLERESENLAAAVEALRKAVSLNPEDTVAVSLLGAYLSQAGRAGEAVDLLEPYTRREEPDVEVLIAGGLALAKLGRHREALTALAKAREGDPSNAMVLVNLGTVHLMARDRERARETFEAALAQNPRVARAHSSLGVMEAEDGRVEEAIDRWKKAVALDAREYEKLLSLSSFLLSGGRSVEARAYLEFFVASAPPALYTRDIERARSWLASPTKRSNGRDRN